MKNKTIGLIDYNNYDIDNLEERLEYPLTDDNLEMYLGKAVEIINFSELKNYNHIDELLPGLNSYVILLIEEEQNTGHWICMMKYKSNRKTVIEYFNSYGFTPGYEMKWFQDRFGQDINDLTYLLDNNKYDVIYNKFKFQDINNLNSNACGRHVICRIITMKNMKYNLEDYIEMMKKLKTKYKLKTYDLLISLLI